MRSFSSKISEDKSKNNSDAYLFLFEKLQTSCRKTGDYQSYKNFGFAQDYNGPKRHNDLLGVLPQIKINSSAEIHALDQPLNGVIDNSVNQGQYKYRSECKQENDFERGGLEEFKSKCISDIDLYKIGGSDSEYNSDYELDISNESNKPCVLLENEDPDGLLIPDMDIANNCNSYESDDSFTIINCEQYNDNQIYEEFSNLTDEVDMEKISETTSEILKINSNPDLHNAEDTIKDRNRNKRFTFGRTGFRAMSNYYKCCFEPMLKEWEKLEDTEEKTTMDELVTEFIKNQFELGDAFVSSPNFEHFLNGMVTVLHSHNHRRNVEYIK